MLSSSRAWWLPTSRICRSDKSKEGLSVVSYQCFIAPGAVTAHMCLDLGGYGGLSLPVYVAYSRSDQYDA